MAIYTYKAKEISGEDHNGEIESSDPKTAATILRKKGLIVTSVTLKPQSLLIRMEKILNRVSFSSLVNMTRQLATMVGAGLVLSEAIDILAEQESNKRLKKVLAEVSDGIKGGRTLAQALGAHQDIFPAVYINLVKSGESSGTLDKVLLKMADNLEKEREFKARIKNAMIYPIIVVCMMIGVMVLMMTFVVPRLVGLYSEATLELPLPTRILIAISFVFSSFWWLVLIILLAVVYFLRRWAKTVHGKIILDNIYLKIPIIGKLISTVTLTNFSRTFGLLITSGLPLLEAINIVADITNNSVFKKALKESYLGVERGLTLSSLLLPPLFPSLVGQMIRVGEETGKVDAIFFKLAEYFESESDHMVKNLTVAIEPIILIILGIAVGFLVIAIILPIYQLTNLAT